MPASTSSTSRSLSKDSQCAFSTSSKPPMLPSQTPLDVDENENENVHQPNANETNEEEWGLSKVMCITIDNASSNDSATSQLKKGLLKKNAFVLGRDEFHMRCCAHIIQLVVRVGLDVVQGSIKRIKDVVKDTRQSTTL
ncbi:hypothetical protein GH714_030258 [Hevea brasiliensis]|uniref:hAT-like transposase RNase-H fold domain-containing protein n=1 Tax=Hevea brasiliensis TaxID=3981 RepID=A0A6A6LKB4_HEVBR|nr:hypothetical protein GH714_030258 [Hevea brasiliensis]